MQSANDLPFFTRKLFTEATASEFNSDHGYLRNYYNHLKDYAQAHSRNDELNQLLKAFHSLHHPAHDKDLTIALEEIYKYDKFLRDFDEYFAQLNLRNSKIFNIKAKPIPELPEIPKTVSIDIPAIVAIQNHPKRLSQIEGISSNNNAEKSINQALQQEQQRLLALSNEQRQNQALQQEQQRLLALSNEQRHNQALQQEQQRLLALSKQKQQNAALRREQAQLRQLTTEMNFQELLDNPTYLISGNKINSKEREKNYMLGDDFPSLSPGASIESKRDLLRQLDQLKEKQQKLISDRIKLLEQRMQIEGYELPNDTMNTEKDLPNEQTTRQIQGINKTASKKQVISTKTSDTSHKADLDDAKSLIKQGKASLALSRLKSLDESAKKISEYHFLTGRAYQELKLNTESLESYSLAIHINPDNDKYWINRGLIKGALKDPQGSLKDLTKALSIRESSQAYLNRGVTNASLNNLSTAIEDLNNAIQLDPNYSQAYRNRGIIHKHRGDKYTACTDWKKAHQLGDSEVKTWIDAYCTKQSS